MFQRLRQDASHTVTDSKVHKGRRGLLNLRLEDAVEKEIGPASFVVCIWA